MNKPYVLSSRNTEGWGAGRVRNLPFPSLFFYFCILFSFGFVCRESGVFFCGNMFIGSNLRITCIHGIIGYLSFPLDDLLNLIWLFLGSSVVLKTALFIFFPRLLFHLVCVPLLLCPFICWWTFCLFACLGYCKYCCNKHWGACIFSNPCFCYFSVYVSRSGFAGSYGSLIFSFWGSSILFSIVAAPIYTPTDSIQGFPFLHILSILTIKWCCLIFRHVLTWQTWSGIPFCF